MSDCPDDNQLVAYASGTLPSPEAQALELHLDGCDLCRTLAAEALQQDLPSASDDGSACAPEAGVVLGPGSVLGRYVVLARVGAGGMGTVYSAYDPTLERRVALKLLHAEARTSEDAQTAQGRLLREAQAMARLAHPNVVSIFDVGTWRDRVFLAMEYVDGGTLRSWVAHPDRTQQQIVEALLQAGRGLQAAHEVGLVHRDFKPDNVLVGRDGRVLVTDFGLAHAQLEVQVALDLSRASEGGPLAAHGPQGQGAVTQNSTLAGALVGTPAYMAPEQLLRQPADARSDQFAFCVTAWEALCGQRPFEFEHLRQLAATLLSSQAAPHTPSNPLGARARLGPVRPPASARLASHLVTALQQGLSLEPEQRHASLGVLLARLEANPSARRRARWTVAVLTLTLLLGATSWLVQWNRARSLRCSGGVAQIAARWGEAQQKALRTRFQEVAADFGDDAARRVIRLLSQRGEAWAAMHQEACEATRVRGVQSEPLLTLRMTCLDRRLQEFDGLIGLFQTADQPLIEDAVTTALRLPGLETCADLEGLLAPVPLPADPAVRAEVERLSPELAHVRVLFIAGRYRDGLTAAQALWDQVARVQHAPTRAEARLLLGTLLSLRGKPKEAAESLREAILEADRGRADLIRVEAATTLVTDLIDRDRLDEAQAQWAAADAILTRLGTAPLERARLHAIRGMLHDAQGDTEQAAEDHRRAASGYAAVLGTDSPTRALALTNLASALERLGRLDEAREVIHEATAIEARHFGEDHPTLTASLTVMAKLQSAAGVHDQAIAAIERAGSIVRAHFAPTHRRQFWVLDDKAVILQAARRWEASLKVYRESLALKQQLLPADDPEFSYSFDGVGQCLLELGRADEAVPYLERSIALVGSDYLARGDTRFALARALTTLRREPARVEALLGDALADFSLAKRDDKRAAVNAWRHAALAKR